MKWIREIRAVGFKDWFWFVVILKRNEFHKSLDLWAHRKEYPHFNKMNRLRTRAHQIELSLQ
jgi:hypothetical protein